MFNLLMLFQDKPQQPAPSLSQQLFALLFPLAICFLIFWFMLIRPQRKEQKKRQEMLNAIGKDDHVWISPGIFGIIEKVKGDYLVVKVDEKNDVKLRVLKSAVIAIDKKGTAGSDSSVQESNTEKK